MPRKEPQYTGHSDLQTHTRCVGGPPLSSGEGPTVAERSNALVRGLVVICNHHGLHDGMDHILSEQIHTYLDDSESERIWLKRVKYMLALPLARYLGNEPPACPDKEFSLSGKLGRWYSNRVRIFSRKNTHLWYSWYQAKRATLPVSDEFVADTYRDHYSMLSSPDTGHGETIDAIFLDRTFSDLLDYISEQVREQYCSNGEYWEKDCSTSACFEYTRSLGGQDGYINDNSGIHSGIPFDSRLSTMSWYPRLLAKDGVFSNVTVECRTLDCMESWRDSCLLQESKLDRVSPIKCTIQAVLEPCKVRVISKGESYPYWMMRPLQKVLHSTLRKMDCFRLIGRPFCPTDLFDLTEKLTEEEEEEWFSIDYSAATDGLSWGYSKRILETVTRYLPRHVRDMALRVLGPHLLHYPDGEGGVCVAGMQQNGQLMGSILSFPILCLANLGVYLLNTSEYQSDWNHSERLRHVLVNGDDMLYTAPSRLWYSHISIGNAVGLKMSLGKAYHHRVYSNVNSTSCHFDLGKLKSETPWQIDFLNVGLFYGQHKVQGRRDDGAMDLASSHHVEGDGTKSSVINVLLQGSLPGRQVDLLSTYLVQHQEEIQHECTFFLSGKRYDRNLFLPVSNGGMGVLPPAGWKFRISQAQRNLYIETTKSGLPVSYGFPLPGYSIREVDTLQGTPFTKLLSGDREVLRIRAGKDSVARRWRLMLPNIPYYPCQGGIVRVEGARMGSVSVNGPKRWHGSRPSLSAELEGENEIPGPEEGSNNCEIDLPALEEKVLTSDEYQQRLQNLVDTYLETDPFPWEDRCVDSQ